jgi:transcriptional regulator with XRE-family HTH domain
MKFHSEHLKSIREARSMSQEALAKRLDVTRQAVIHWEKGDNNPSLDTIGRLAQIFNVNYAFFIQETP